MYTIVQTEHIQFSPRKQLQEHERCLRDTGEWERAREPVREEDSGEGCLQYAVCKDTEEYEAETESNSEQDSIVMCETPEVEAEAEAEDAPKWVVTG